jgi:hypothetical protein
MTLKTNFNPLILTGCLSAMILTSCGSHVQKTDDAFDLVKKERMMTTDSNFVSKEVIEESLKTTVVKKIETPDEWTKFRNEMEKKIHKNEKTIKEIEGLPELNAGLRRKVTNLEKANNDMKIRMDEYKEEMKVKWEMFQASMNHTINEIDIELNALKTNNKK